MADVLYEPRSFWEVRQIAVTNGNTDPQTVVLDLQNFYNDGKYPVVIEKIVVAPIGYYFKRFGDPTGAFAINGYASGSIIDLTGLVFSARRRVSFPAKEPILSSEIGNISTNPRMPFNAGTPASQFSSFTGAIYKHFTFPLVLPNDVAFFLELTNYPGAPSGPGNHPPSWSLAFHERLPGDKALFPGHARLFGHAAQRSLQDPLGGVLRSSPTTFGTQAPVTPIAPTGVQAPVPTSPMLYPPEQSVRSREFLAQNPRVEGSAEFYGMSCMIEQIGYDDAAITGAGASTPLAMSMLALNIGCRAQVRTAGTQARWWRDGIPLALAFDDITPAIVYKLDKPVTMDPGDQWEIEVTVPGVQQILVNNQLTKAPAVYSLGVSLNGYAIVEG